MLFCNMFIGHFAVGFASKRFAPRTNLGVLMAAPSFLDLLWPFFLLVGWEKVRTDLGNTRFSKFDFVSYPWSHSLLMSVVWASIFALVYYAITRYRAGAIAIWIGVVSHWIFDWTTHRPDLPLYPGGPKFGLGLWNSVAGTMTVELLLLAVGLWMYIGATRARDRIGRYGLLGYVVLLLLIYIGDRFSAPPSSVPVLAWSCIIAEVVLILWAWWFDRHRALHVEDPA
jgi:membrane-bound metal-dependent hydrolase YbcI (DUF457 family)